jgi:hypothetical protein
MGQSGARAVSGFPPLATELRTSLVIRVVPFPDFGAVLNDFRFWQMEMVGERRQNVSKFLAHGRVTIEAIWLRTNVSAPPGFLAKFS